jgi:DNA-directed RNA polymerase specialized sigma24 family protein
MPRSPHSTAEWGTLEVGYKDEFGAVAPDLYAAAGRLQRLAEAYAARVLSCSDPARIVTLLLKAAAQVTRARDERSQPVHEVDGYLFQTFKHVVLAELEKDNNRLRYEAEAHLNAEWHAQATNVERRILLNELVAAMDEWTRAVFEWLTLDYSFEEIARHVGMNPKVVRTKYNRRLTRLMKQFESRPGAEIREDAGLTRRL